MISISDHCSLTFNTNASSPTSFFPLWHLLDSDNSTRFSLWILVFGTTKKILHLAWDYKQAKEILNYWYVRHTCSPTLSQTPKQTSNHGDIKKCFIWNLQYWTRHVKTNICISSVSKCPHVNTRAKFPTVSCAIVVCVTSYNKCVHVTPQQFPNNQLC